MAGRPAIYRGFRVRRRARPAGRRRGARRHRPRDRVEGRVAARRRPRGRRRRAGLRASRRLGLPAARRPRDGAPGARPGGRPGARRGDPERRDPRPLGDQPRSDRPSAGRGCRRGGDLRPLGRWRARANGRDLLRARNVADPANPGPSGHSGAREAPPSSADPASTATGWSTRGRPGTRTGSSSDCSGPKRKKRAKTTLMRSVVDGLSNPSIHGKLAALRPQHQARRPAEARRRRRPRAGAHPALASPRHALVDGALGAARLRHPDQRHRSAAADPVGAALVALRH